jgi:hypothetical protein
MSLTRVKPESAPDRPGAASDTSSRVFWPILLLIALIGLVIRVYIGWKTFIDFDEWQHIFMASGARWADVAFELRTNAHPPLFFLLLRALAHLAPRNPAIYRSFSIAAGVGSVIVVGLIARKILDSPVIQLLCVAVFALSADAIAISDEIRSYQLAVFLVLLAFLSWLEMACGAGASACPRRPRETASKQPFLMFAICSSLAVSSHYSAVFFLGACLAVSLLLCARSIRNSPWLFASAMAVPFAVFAFQYFVHASVQPIQGYLFDFYGGVTPGESAADFVVRNSRNFFNLFSPVECRSTAAFLPFLLLLGMAAAWSLSKRLRISNKGSAAPILLAVVMVLELLVASLAQKYPFGGLLRHQYIAGPFVLIAAFVVLDSLVSVVGRRRQYAISALLFGASIANLIAEGPKLIQYPGAVLVQRQFDAWQSAFPDTRAVYLDHWAVMGYFIHTTDRPRTFVRRIPGEAVIDEYHLPGGTEIFYDKTRSTLDFSDPSVYRSLAACLRASRAEELSLFFLSAGYTPFPATPEKMQKLVTDEAAAQGLTTTKVMVGKTYLFAGFQLAQSR